ncbi:uncharacterized protein N7498_006696 [Penicillium cinerascens]|uniref:Uncharacterized protein n=1 Tax=Penicillium cinerascens TaxID=70096 RepID=A0A9W9MIQ4_9EURO|nr:uncharacterized protein N7498_006696 [Penicillium cinerascens]KAJ5202033.1 hypothetical protein N7498_006696 [Penicillium cinerascens]
MATFGKLTAALMSASQENTLALANLNFDFTLMKWEAPTEYRGLGDCLSTKRKRTAEDGPLHVTARKLSALFESEIPQVPHLIRAYGKRSSEIAKMPTINPQASQSTGVFADYVGADGATIWATATSGEGAVTIHLLACLLARIWTRSEAVSIWSELVETRKELLYQKTHSHGSSFQISDATASRIDVTRDQLASWDASARDWKAGLMYRVLIWLFSSWLQAADEAKRLQQTQLKLVLDNISIPVSTKPKLYDAIIEAWKVAMCALDNLILGQAQRIQSGEVLLGLSSWHLYPDLSVLDGKQHHIKQGDPLISSGGIVTIGLKNRPEQLDEGIFWSLPLAHLRFYGDPVIATCRTGLRESQITFNQFQAVVLGSVLSSWNFLDPNIELPCEIINILGRSLPPGASCGDLGWLGILFETTKLLQNAKNPEKDELHRLVRFGQRRCAGFISDQNARPPPVFGLANLENVLLAAIDRQRAKEFLHNWAAARFPKNILQCAVVRDWAAKYQKARYSKLIAQNARPKKRSREGVLQTNAHGIYTEWLSDDELDRDDGRGYNIDQDYEDDHGEYYESRTLDTIFISPEPDAAPEEFQFLCGMESLGIYVPTSVPILKGFVEETRLLDFERNVLHLSDLRAWFRSGSVDFRVVARKLQSTTQIPRYQNYFDSLRAFSKAHEIYSYLPGARVDLRLTDHSMRSQWWSATTRIQGNMSLGRTFSCIALFETGYLDIDPDSFKDALAICCDNSIFVASLLLRDPLEEAANTHENVCRITGNIGKPGFAILIPPSDPKIKKIDYSSWKAIDHQPFDGRLLDSFSASSLHLSLTGYELALDVGHRGARDHDCIFVETAISLIDSGEWMADLDIIKAQSNWQKVHSRAHLCDHDQNYPPGISLDDLGFLTSADNWFDLLDRPLSHCIVRSRGNTMARLAAASIAVQKGYKFKILSTKACLTCVSWEIHAAIQEGDNSNDEAEGLNDDQSHETDHEESPIHDFQHLLPSLFPGLEAESFQFNSLEPRSSENRRIVFIC